MSEERYYLSLYLGNLVISFPKGWELEAIAYSDKYKPSRTAFKFKRGPCRNGWLVVWPEYDGPHIYFRWMLVDTLPRDFEYYGKNRPPTVDGELSVKLFGCSSEVHNLDDLF